MKIMRAFLVCASLLFAIAAGAQERILNYDVTIDVQKNADLIVTENITVNSEGRSIRRGIFRDLPRYKLDEGDTIPYQYKILSITKNGEREPFENSTNGNAKRLRIGDADVFLENGEYTYEITYRVKNEIRYGDTADELYWNVTGNYWNFPIERARAVVNFPSGTTPDAVQEINGYAGVLGRKNVPTQVSERFDPMVIDVVGAMQPREGLTLSVLFDKGVIDPPTTADKTLLWWFKNGALFFLSFSFVGLFAYYYRAWNKVGRDPDKLPVYPRYAPPEGYSAAAVSHITHKFVAVSAAPLISTLMSLAVKGAVHIESQKKSTTLNYLRKADLSAQLLADEEFLLQRLFKKKDQMNLEGKYNSDFTSAHMAFNRRIIKNYSNDYFRWNAGHTVLGLGLSVAAFVLAVSQVYGAWKTGFVIIFGALILMNLIFMFLMPAPTQKGAQVTSEIEGFKLYLKTAESKRFAKDISENVAKAPPTMTQELYERYLPYAVALDVEKPWSKYFEKMLPQEAKAYDPGWGQIHTARGGASRFAKTLNSNLSSGVSSSLPQSSSSGGGGGGSSGGGGGGGGGGGW